MRSRQENGLSKAVIISRTKVALDSEGASNSREQRGKGMSYSHSSHLSCVPEPRACVTGLFLKRKDGLTGCTNAFVEAVGKLARFERPGGIVMNNPVRAGPGVSLQNELRT